MTKIIIDIFMYLFEGMLVFYYSNSLFSLKRSKCTQIVFIALVFTLLFSIYQLNINYLNATLIFISYCFLFCFLYNISFRTAAFHSFIFLIVMFASEELVLAISAILYKDYNAYENNTAAYLFAVITSKLIYFGIMMIILKMLAQKEKKEQHNKYFWLLFIMPLVSIIILFCFRYLTFQVQLTQTMSIFWIFLSIGILFVNILVFAIYELSIKNTKELYELKTIQHQEEQDKLYFEIIEQSNNDMRVFSHDIKNHLMQIRNLENLEEVQRYIDGIYPEVEKFSRTGISKNKMLDLIISKYAMLCERKNIKFSIDVKTANLSYINDTDLSTLMNNLLDNAVEAAEKSDGGFVQVNIFSKNNIHDGLIIKNSCSVAPITEKSELITTKQNKKISGIGTKSIKKVIRKYNAVYGWEYDKDLGIFETNIVFTKKN